MKRFPLELDTQKTFRSVLQVKRRGSILTIVMVSLLICSLITGSLLTLARRAGRQSFREEHRLQASLYAVAGLERAVLRLKEDSGYRGEEWKPPQDRADHAESGLVTIRVQPVSESATQGEGTVDLKISVSARYPIEVENPPQCLREFMYLKRTGSPPKPE